MLFCFTLWPYINTSETTQIEKKSIILDLFIFFKLQVIKEIFSTTEKHQKLTLTFSIKNRLPNERSIETESINFLDSLIHSKVILEHFLVQIVVSLYTLFIFCNVQQNLILSFWINY